MSDVERRLDDAFGAVRAQVRAPAPVVVPMRRPAPRAPRTFLPSVAATVAVLVAVAALAGRGGEEDRGVASGGPPVVAVEEFNRAADGICRVMLRDISGVGPRFSTAEAYTVSGGRYVEVSDAALVAVVGLSPPAGDVDLPGRVAVELGTAGAAARRVVTMAGAGDLEAAGSALAEADAALRAAAGGLGAYGAPACNTD